MPMVNNRAVKKDSTDKKADSAKESENGVKNQWFNYNAGQTTSNQPTREPRSIGSSIVRRNEPDDED